MLQKALISYLEKKIIQKINEKDLVIIGIDGPTASGKTILANELAKNLEYNNSNIKVDFYRLDWQLKEREDRIKDLAIINKAFQEFSLEGEMHMYLKDFKSFLENIIIKHNLIGISNKDDSQTFEINNLYNRENSGKRTGNYKYDLKKKLIIICEGHYTSRAEYAGMIDLNICLLSNFEELLKRKIDRVSGYRGAQEAENYFNLIDIPSFKYHLKRFKRNIDIVIDNSDYEHPIIKENEFVKTWLEYHLANVNIKTKNDRKLSNLETIFKKIFSISKCGIKLDQEIFEIIIKLHSKFHYITGNRIIRQVEFTEYDLNNEISNAILETQKDINKIDKKIKLEIATKNSFNISPRKKDLPITIGINLINDINIETYYRFLFSIYQNRCELIISWEGGTFLIEKNINLSEIVNKTSIDQDWNLLNLKDEKSDDGKKNLISVYIPTDYCIPAFLKNEKFKIIYTRKEHELTPFYNLLKGIIKNDNKIIIHRFSEFIELNFYKSIIQNTGYASIGIHNYLFAIKTNNNKLLKIFRTWSNSWILNSLLSRESSNNYDYKINDEIIEAKLEIEKNSKEFTLIDSFLIKKGNSSSFKKDSIDELKRMFNSKIRTVRKSAFNYICQESPFISLKIKDLLNIFEIQNNYDNNATIELEEIKYLYPSILAELYLWQHIRGDNSAILGANIYDLKGDLSLDSLGILSAAASRNVPVVIQSSFNALGQKENDNDLVREGYLKVLNGADDLISYSIKSSIYNKFINHNKSNLYGIGLDHVDSRNDFPHGRAKRFLNNALENKNLTHLVIDGSSRFNAKDRTYDSLSEAYYEVANYEKELLITEKETFLIDKEYCIGELSYIGDEKLPMIPRDDEIILFITKLRKLFVENNLDYENCRPSLFIGNVGTTHHSSDENNVNSSITGKWLNKTKNFGFISAVLHGTTNSSKNVLAKSTLGCHKVNVAGDFLKTFQESLPKYTNPSFREFSVDSKYLMPRISLEKENFKNKEIENIIKNIESKAKEIIQTINSPSLTERDQKFFHRFSYSFDKKVIDLILKEFEKKIIYENKKNQNYKNKLTGHFSASMIEVPFENGFREFAESLIENGIKYFHIDEGDGKFISRSFSGIDKARYLTSINKDLSIHVHLMVENPMTKDNSNQSIVQKYIDSGISRIAFHSRSFKKESELIDAINFVESSGCVPGIIIETNSIDMEEIWKFIKKNSLRWIIMMGVPIGYGGQLFVPNTIEKIRFLRQKSIDNDYKLDIEADGGLNFENLNNCFINGANIFAGWSIIKSKDCSEIIKKYKQIEKIIKE